MAIRYKVVDDNRESCFISDPMFSLYYGKDQTITAKPNTLGIFVFDTENHARDFLIKQKDRKFTILKVMAHGRGKRMRSRPIYYGTKYFTEVYELFRCGGINHLFNLAKKSHDIAVNYSGICLKPRDDGTMVYNSITVLD